jgi:hypothetical protein
MVLMASVSHDDRSGIRRPDYAAGNACEQAIREG